MTSTHPKRITLKDVAREAGVATGTVSMVLNDNKLVADATRAHVQEVIRRLGYVYDRTAGHLRNRRSNIIGLAMCDLSNPYFASVTAGLQEAVDNLGRVLVLGNCSESVPRQLRFLETLREYNVEGLLLTPVVSTPKAHLEQILAWKLPVVQITRYIVGIDTDRVGSDNRLGSALATKHLIELGHQRIGYIGFNRRTTTGRDRFAGFRSALKEAGHAISDHLTIECAPTREDGFAAILRLFDTPEPPTAIVCFNDIVAFGVMLGLRRLGMEPGRECSVVGIDDVAEAALWQPSLTSVAVSPQRIGQAAGRLVSCRIQEPDRPIERVILQPQLVVRDSCNAPPPPSERKRRQRSN